MRKDFENIHFGEAIKELIERSGKPKKDIAAELGVNQASLSATFASKMVRLETIYKICEICNTPAWQFLASLETELHPTVFKVIDAAAGLTLDKRVAVMRIFADAVELAAC